MNPVFTFVLGLLIGWLIEWLIDFFYWRRRYAEREVVPMFDRHEHKTTSVAKVEPAPVVLAEEPKAAVPVVPDNLQIIKGIGKVIERKLNDAGIYTFEQLGNLTPADLQSILGKTIERLANEESLLQQARDLARRK